MRRFWTPQAARLLGVLSGAGLALCTLQSPGTAVAQPASCPLDPVALPLFQATPADVIVATPASAGGEVPEPSDEEVNDAAEDIVACTNNTAQGVRYSVFTDRYLASLFTGDDAADQPAFERMIATGTEPATPENSLEGVSDIEQHPDGRVAVTMHISTASGDVSDRVLLAWDDEAAAWLIDDIVELEPQPSTPAEVTVTIVHAPSVVL